MATRAASQHAERNRSRVTISDVARALDLTKSTVSRALNGYPDISEATRQRVVRMADQLNYQPLSYAQAVRTGRTRSLGFVLQLSDHDAMRPFLAEFLAGMSEGASDGGYTLTVASSDSDTRLPEIFDSLSRDGKADGFVLPRAMVNDSRVQQLRDAHVPFVLYGRPHVQEGCAWFDIRGEDSMKASVLRLAALGHRRIGFINGGLIYEYARLRRIGFLQGLEEAKLRPDPSLIIEDAVKLCEGAAAAEKLLSRTDPPTAIVCAVDRVALGVYQTATLRGMTIGADLSVTGYDGIPEGEHASPPLSTFYVDNRDAGHRLATLLMRRIQGEAPETLRETTAATFVDRGSIGPPKRSKHT